MRIIECTLTEFGAFQDKSFSFGDGLNIIEGENESGKSTLLAFIKFMFYGVPRKSAGEAVPERDRILSWEGGVACGRMTLETADGTFRIERTLRRVQSGARETYPETVRLIDLATGEQIHRGEEPGEVFFGVPLSVFESTCAVRQSQCARLHTAELGSSIENLLFTGDESLDTQRAAAKLDSARRQLLHKNSKGGRLYELGTERQNVRERLARARMLAEAIVARGLRLEQSKKQIAQQRERLAVCEEKCNYFETDSLLRRFEQMHETERRSAALHDRLQELHRTHAYRDYLPDDAYLATLRGLKQRLQAALTDHLQAREEKDAAAREATPNEREGKRLAHAEQLRAAGGTEQLMSRFHSFSTAARQMAIPAAILTVLAILMMVLGVGGLFLPTISPTLAIAGLGIGAILGVAGIVCFRLRRRTLAKLTALLDSYGSSPQCTEQALRGYLDGCATLLRRHTMAQEALQDAVQLLSERERVLGVVCDECVEALSRMGIRGDREEPEELYDRLDGALTKFSAVAVEHGRVRREWEHAATLLQELRRELAGQNEAELRAYLPADRIPTAAGEDITGLRIERDYLRRAVSDGEARCAETEKQLVAMEATAEDPRELALRLEELDRENDDCQLRHDALLLAGEALESASARVRRGVTPRLRSGASAWMERLTDGRYRDLGISGTMSVTVDDNGETRPIEAMSGGTVDAAYLSLRLSLLEVLYGLDRPTLLLDESLCQLDDRRTEQFLSMLAGWCASGAQCLLFTCQSRESKLCRDIGQFTHIRLDNSY